MPGAPRPCVVMDLILLASEHESYQPGEYDDADSENGDDYLKSTALGLRRIHFNVVRDQIQRLLDVVTPSSDFDMANYPRDAHHNGVNGHGLTMAFVIDSIVSGDATRAADFARKVTTLRGKPWVMSLQLAQRIVHHSHAEQRVALLRLMWDGPVLADPAVRNELLRGARECDAPVFNTWAVEAGAAIGHSAQE
ncbi:hypothetical protein H9P43_006861 [Blastocladiella emersonii ATCC 22665]|nr:hypothetical protein H9P43_006861 [Blastocladiella emersonii ATCC 22665]